MKIEEILNNKNTSLVDVRSFDEFEEGTVEGAINIPLHTIPECLEQFKSMQTPVVVFCRSGARSYQASTWLKHNGVEVFDGGGIGSVMALKKS